jgi:hypothetical protein
VPYYMGGAIWIFRTIILSFLEKKMFRSKQFSLLMYRCLLPLSVTVKMDYEKNMENVRYATNDDTPLWLNHLVLLYKEFNCIRIMSLNTYNKNVDIIWHYCIISQINYMVSENDQLSQIWRQTHWSIRSIDYDMAFFISHAISTLDPY